MFLNLHTHEFSCYNKKLELGGVRENLYTVGLLQVICYAHAIQSRIAIV